MLAGAVGLELALEYDPALSGLYVPFVPLSTCRIPVTIIPPSPVFTDPLPRFDIDCSSGEYSCKKMRLSKELHQKAKV